jgi:large subunit ribosomal protein L9
VSSNVKVLLETDVENLGTGGEVVRVRSGFARNYLLPRGLAVIASAGSLKRVDELKKAAAVRKQAEVASAQELAKKISGVKVTLERAVGEEGKMYGSVTTRDIEEAFLKAGVTIDKRKIVLADPIKELGSYEVPLKLSAGVEAVLKVEVAKKGG